MNRFPVVALSLLLACTPVLAQSEEAAEMSSEVRTLLERVAKKRGADDLPDSLAIEATYKVMFEGAPGDQPVAQGAYREAYHGEHFARHTTEMGPMGKMERGTTEGLVWEVDPSMGAKRYDGPSAATVRRYFAIMRGSRPETLYAKIVQRAKGSSSEQVVLEMHPEAGKPDVLYIDPNNAVVRKIEMHLPSPDSAGSVFDMKETMLAAIEFDDWRKVGKVSYPHLRRLKMGPATIVTTCAEIAVETKLGDDAFAVPEVCAKLEPKIDAAPIGDGAGKPEFSIVDHKTQLVVSIRTKCKPTEISATLAKLLPEVMAHVTATGGRIAGPPFSRYHAFSDASIDLEAGIPVAAKLEEKGRVKNSELPAGKVLTGWHIGSYEKLGAAHKALHAHAARSKLEIAGGVWEIYWTDPGMVPDPKKWRTQLFLPIESK